jgi:hypothetical protein
MSWEWEICDVAVKRVTFQDKSRIILYCIYVTQYFIVLLNPKYCSVETYDITDALDCCNKENFAIYLFLLNRFLT